MPHASVNVACQEFVAMTVQPFDPTLPGSASPSSLFVTPLSHLPTPLDPATGLPLPLGSGDSVLDSAWELAIGAITPDMLSTGSDPAEPRYETVTWFQPPPLQGPLFSFENAIPPTNLSHRPTDTAALDLTPTHTDSADVTSTSVNTPEEPAPYILPTRGQVPLPHKPHTPSKPSRQYCSKLPGGQV
jgi:hypothetical protein